MNALMTIDNLSPVEMQSLQEQLMVKRMQYFQSQLEVFRNEIDYTKEEIKDLRVKQEKSQEIAVNKYAMVVIDKWLKANGYFETFYSIKSESDMEDFICDLHSKYCDKTEEDTLLWKY